MRFYRRGNKLAIRMVRSGPDAPNRRAILLKDTDQAHSRATSLSFLSFFVRCQAQTGFRALRIKYFSINQLLRVFSENITAAASA
jgi:hypothetical protein